MIGHSSFGQLRFAAATGSNGKWAWVSAVGSEIPAAVVATWESSEPDSCLEFASYAEEGQSTESGSLLGRLARDLEEGIEGSAAVAGTTRSRCLTLLRSPCCPS